ncbi:MAG: hypothetical protein RL154_75 [Pseudomonadota bacterium]|jgi:hypothetical protein
MQKSIMSLYLFIISGTAISIFVIGVFVAPVIFAHEQFLHIALFNRFEAGLLMTKIFQRFNIILAICGLIIAAIEGTALVQKRTSKAVVIFAALSVVEIAAFLLYFTPMIISMQAQGETTLTTVDFSNIHNLAELDFKAMLMTLTGLAFLRFSRAVKDNPCGCEEEEEKK